MPDLWESLYGLNPLVDDSGSDLDGDGLSNLGEKTSGSNPVLPDSDLDGLTDGAEVNQHGSSPICPIPIWTAILTLLKSPLD